MYTTCVFASPKSGMSQVRVYAAFVNDILQFVKQPDGSYRAQYELRVEIVDRHGDRQEGSILKREIAASGYSETNSRQELNQHQFAFDVPAGEYEIIFELTDLDNGRHLKRTNNLPVRNFSESLVSLSDIMFVDAACSDSLPFQPVFPNMSKTLETLNSDFGAYFEGQCRERFR